MTMRPFWRNRCGSKRLRPAARPHAMTRRKHPTSSVLANLLRLAESRSVRESQQDSVPKPKGCEGRATRGHRPTNIPNRNAVAANSFPSGRVTFATTPLALFPFPARTPKVGVTRQPWAGGRNPFGIVRSAGLRRHRPALRELADRRFEAYPSCTSGLLRQVELV